jgi:hypothetical protein
MEDKNAEEGAYGWRADGGGGTPATSSRLTALQKVSSFDLYSCDFFPCSLLLLPSPPEDAMH